MNTTNIKTERTQIARQMSIACKRTVFNSIKEHNEFMDSQAKLLIELTIKIVQ